MGQVLLPPFKGGPYKCPSKIWRVAMPLNSCYSNFMRCDGMSILGGVG